jgi:hypothetical protein
MVALAAASQKQEPGGDQDDGPDEVPAKAAEQSEIVDQ